MAAAISNWTPDQLGDLTGRNYLITGGNSGIGFHAARMLGEKGANVIIACRNDQKAADAAQRLAATSKGRVDTVKLDLSSLTDVRRAAKETAEKFDGFDALINNAGIMQTPQTRTEDGHELQLATNHLGHFLWTNLLMDKVNKDHGRVVNISSIAHKLGKMDFDDLMFDNRRYDSSVAYGQSKLANIHFTQELSRRLAGQSSKISAIACHPGYSATELQSTGPQGLLNFVYKFTNRMMAQEAHKGAIPTVLAAAGEGVISGGYYGPTGMLDLGGPVGTATIAQHGLVPEHASRLWDMSEELVGEKFAL